MTKRYSINHTLWSIIEIEYNGLVVMKTIRILGMKINFINKNVIKG